MLSALPDYVTERAVKAGGLVRLNVDEVEIAVWKQLLYQRDKWVSLQMESLLKYCVSSEFSGKPG